ncbi:hypothetical protein E4U33_008107 [Claviceps sp. LM78 group G4]|nr:hypothetical protein E4U33_008107 [Claviceps sp. LM78 group G4]
MTSGPKNLYRVAHVEDAAEESGDCIVGKPGTRKYATRATPVTPVPQSKANTSKSRSDKRPVAPTTPSASADLVSEPQDAADEDDALRDENQPSREDSDEIDARARDRAERRRERRLRDDEKKAQAAVTSTKDDTRAQRLHRPTTLKQSATQPLPNPSYRRGSTDEMPIYAFPQPIPSAPGPGFDPTSGSYFDGQQFRPVPMNMVWHPPRQVAMPFPSPSFPPYSMWNGYGAPPSGYMPPSSLPPPDGYAPGYFDGMPGPSPQPQMHQLHQRFDRPGPGMGYPRPPPSSYYGPSQGDYLWADAPLAPSIERRPLPKSQAQPQPAEDSRKKMPPPDAVPSKASRPKSSLPSASSSSARPTSHHGHSKPRDSHRRSVHAANKRGDSPGKAEQDHDAYSPDGEDFDDDNVEGEYQDPAAPKTRRGSTNHHHRRHHHQHHQPQPQHEPEPEPRTTPSTRKHRPPPYDSHAPTPPPLCPSGLGPKYEKKYYDALAYQEKVSRRPSPFSQVPLTAEHIRKAGRRGEVPSSHSTRSSQNSRRGEESSHKRSSGTRTSRTQSGGGEDFRIKISGGARLRVSGAEIDCGDNAEIVFAGPRGRGGAGGSDSGSGSGSSSSGTARMVEDLRSRRGERETEREREKVLPRRQRGGSPGEWSTQGGGSRERERSSRGSR